MERERSKANSKGKKIKKQLVWADEDHEVGEALAKVGGDIDGKKSTLPTRGDGQDLLLERVNGLLRGKPSSRADAADEEIEAASKDLRSQGEDKGTLHAFGKRTDIEQRKGVNVDRRDGKTGCFPTQDRGKGDAGWKVGIVTPPAALERPLKRCCCGGGGQPIHTLSNHPRNFVFPRGIRQSDSPGRVFGAWLRII